MGQEARGEREKSFDHRHHRSGWVVPGGIVTRQGLRGLGRHPPSSSFNTGRIDHLYQDPHEGDVRLRLIYGDLNDASSLNKILRMVRPDEIYNLGAQSHVRVSFEIPEYTAEVTASERCDCSRRFVNRGLKPAFYQASSCEMYGKVQEMPQTETTPFYPRSPYGVAKAMPIRSR